MPHWLVFANPSRGDFLGAARPGIRSGLNRAVRWPAVLLTVVTLASASACGAPPNPESAGDSLTSQVGFAFDIVNLETDHQFPGQTSTLHISYQYRHGLQGAGFDPSGHQVPGDTYPYFQDIQNEVTGFVRAYPNKSDFYEVFLDNAARDVMNKFPQLSSLEIRADVPAYGGVPTARTAIVDVARG